MKTNIFKAGMAMSLCIAAFATSCSDRIAEDYAPATEQVPLEISVAGINDTRSLISGTTLPDTCAFSVFFNSNYSTLVRYENGSCKLNNAIFLDESTQSAPVYAFYPTTDYLTEIQINTTQREDYLRGISTESINATNNKASILFDHILARITLKIRKDEENENTYEIAAVRLGGNNDKSFRSAIFDAKSNKFIDYAVDQKAEEEYIAPSQIDGPYYHFRYILSEPEDVITADLLVIPSETSWMINFYDWTGKFKEDAWYPLPLTNYESGKQYIYDCIIKENEETYLTITKCDIKPWENTTMPEVEAY